MPANIDAQYSTLQNIRTKVRRITRNPSEAQLSTTDLDNYINTFILYDFPEHLRTFNLRQQFTFRCNPFQDVYPTDTASFVGVTTNQLYNFQNWYLTIHPPVYIAGFNSFFTQSREQFYGIYPQTRSIVKQNAGDGVATQFTGIVTAAQPAFPNPSNNLQQKVCLLQNNVTFSSVATNGSGLVLHDVPVMDTATGNPSTTGNLYVPGTEPATPPTVVLANNNINYVTGAFTITFPSAPATGIPINSQTVPSIVSLPQSMCFYQNQFILRPVPDQPYDINFEVYVRPSELLNAADQPNLAEYWQYISYGASMKVFQDRMDLDSVQLIMPEYKKQEALCLRRTIVQYTNERTATIYTEQVNTQGGGFGFGQGGPF